MGKKRKQLTHAEIWDDSALVNSWNEALEEYQFYHGIHARGERVEDVLKQAEAEEKGEVATTGQDMSSELPNGEAGANAEDAMEDGELEEGEAQAGETLASDGQPDLSSDPPPVIQTAAERGFPEQGPASHEVPHTLAKTVQDESMKNLMMSWYYAGYYTGLHEGQQLAKQTQG